MKFFNENAKKENQVSFYLNMEKSIHSRDIATQLSELMYDDGDAFSDLLNTIADELYASELDANDVATYAEKLDEKGRKLILDLHSALSK